VTSSITRDAVGASEATKPLFLVAGADDSCMASFRISPKKFAKSYKAKTKRLLGFGGLPTRPSPGTIHNLRVSARRFQAIASLLPKKTRRSKEYRRFDLAVKSLLKVTSQTRDFDILADTLGPYTDALPSELLGFVRNERSDAATLALPAMNALSNLSPPSIRPRDVDGKRLSRRLQRRIDGRSRVVEQLLRVVVNDESKVQELHALRIEGKKLRYLLELTDEPRPALSVISKWQDSLGRLHDLDVAMAFLQEKRWDFPKTEVLSRLQRSRHSGYTRFTKKSRNNSATENIAFAGLRMQ